MTEVYARPQANSPFLPNSQLQIAWDSTSIKWFKSCPKLYQYHMIEGWFPKGDNPHLKFGLVFHSATELFDKLLTQGMDREEAVIEAVLHALKETGTYVPNHAFIGCADAPEVCSACQHDIMGHNQLSPKRWVSWTSDHSIKNRENLIRTLIWYFEKYKDDPAEVVVLANGKPAVEYSFRFSTDIVSPSGEPYMLSGHWDKVVTFAGSTYIQDKKTSGHPITDRFFDSFSMDTQMTLYTLAGNAVLGMPVKGIMLEGVHVAVGYSDFLRGFTYRNERQLEEWYTDLQQTFRLAEHYAEVDYYPRNELSCTHYMDNKGFGGCPFRSVCSRHPSQRESVLKTDFMKKRWNPLEARNAE